MKYAVIQLNYVVHSIGETEKEALDQFYVDHFLYENESSPEDTCLADAVSGDMLLLPCDDTLYAEVQEFGGNVLFDVVNGVVVSASF